MIKNRNKSQVKEMLSEKPRTGLSETRKMTKSTMEKKRRARINNSLTELKCILSGMVTNKGERFDKMEKADILEMTVKCVRQLQKQANTGDTNRLHSIPVDEDYKSGMHTCMSEVIKFISSSSFSDTDPEIKTKLLDHLAHKLHSGSNQRTDRVPGLPNSYQTYSHEINTTSPMHAESGPMSNMSNDSNNNLEAINDKVIPLSVHTQPQKSPTITSPANSPVFTQFKPLQPMLDTVQQPQSVPTVPLTILVPANICSAAVGTTCVIPLNIPTASQQLGQNSVLATVTQPSQTNFAINSGSGISLISSSNVLPNVPASSKANDTINLSPEGRVYTFTPTVLSDNQRTPENIFKANDAVKPKVVPFPPILLTQSDHTGSPPQKVTEINDTTATSVFDHQRVVPVTENRTELTKFTQLLVPRLTRANENCSQNHTVKCSFKERDNNIQNQTSHDQTNQRSADKEHSQGHGRAIFTEQNQFIEASNSSSRPFMHVSKPGGNVCDYPAAGMWRPW